MKWSTSFGLCPHPAALHQKTHSALCRVGFLMCQKQTDFILNLCFNERAYWLRGFTGSQQRAGMFHFFHRLRVVLVLEEDNEQHRNNQGIAGKG